MTVRTAIEIALIQWMMEIMTELGKCGELPPSPNLAFWLHGRFRAGVEAKDAARELIRYADEGTITSLYRRTP